MGHNICDPLNHMHKDKLCIPRDQVSFYIMCTEDRYLHIAKWRTAANLSAAAFTPSYLNTQE